MAASNDKRIIIAVGAGLAVVAAVVLALVFSGGRQGPAEPPPASKGGLTVDLADAPALDALFAPLPADEAWSPL